VARAFLAAVLLSCAAFAQQKQPDYPDPPEEDKAIAPRDYAFNPLQAKKELDAGNFYWKKGNYRAAANRYREATLWDDSSPEAFFKLGESHEKLHEYTSAREAFAKFIELSADKNKANDLRKRMAKWPADSQ
jgi:outer membrane protein assembly factor BamD (BamD/ComL family)